MKKKSFILCVSVVVILILLFSISKPSVNYVSAANVGDPLPTPDSGWTRYDTTDWKNTKFMFSGSSWFNQPDSGYWNQSSEGCTAQGETMTFNMTGIGFRVIGCSYYDRCADINVTVNGTPVATYDARYPNGQYLTLCYDSGTLSYGQYTVVISHGSTSGYLEIDAIDIYGTLDGFGSTPTPTPTSIPIYVGDPLPTPESGWTRYDTTDWKNTKFIFSGSSWFNQPDSGYWNQSSEGCTAQGETMTFKMTGTGFRVIGCCYYDRCADINVTVNGTPVATYDARYPNGQYLTLCYDSGTLSYGQYTVVISHGSTSGYLEIDAIDIYGTLDDFGSTPTPTPTSIPIYVGDPLPTPESGWTRYDTTDWKNTKFIFSGSSWFNPPDSGYWNQSSEGCTAQGETMTFKMTGTGFRVIGCSYYDRCADINVTVNGTPVATYDARYPNGQYLTLCYDSGTLSYSQYTVVISHGSTNGYLEIDAIDIYGTLDDF